MSHRPRRGLQSVLLAGFLGFRFASPQALCFRLLRRLVLVVLKELVSHENVCVGFSKEHQPHFFNRAFC